jgi:hypothetical protein
VFLKETSLDVIVVIMGDCGSTNEVKDEFKEEFIALSKPDPEYAAVLFVSNRILRMRNLITGSCSVKARPSLEVSRLVPSTHFVTSTSTSKSRCTTLLQQSELRNQSAISACAMDSKAKSVSSGHPPFPTMEAL